MDAFHAKVRRAFGGDPTPNQSRRSQAQRTKASKREETSPSRGLFPRSPEVERSVACRRPPCRRTALFPAARLLTISELPFPSPPEDAVTSTGRRAFPRPKRLPVRAPGGSLQVVGKLDLRYADYHTPSVRRLARFLPSFIQTSRVERLGCGCRIDGMD